MTIGDYIQSKARTLELMIDALKRANYVDPEDAEYNKQMIEDDYQAMYESYEESAE